jgi:hypothetical protein
MIYLEDLQKAKEQNEQTIQENNELIAKIQKTNCDLEAENRVFDKLILVEKSKEETVEEVFETNNLHENTELIEN